MGEVFFRRVSYNSKKNKMDFNNLTVCLWPTLCPIELPNDMARFEGIRVEVSEIISALIVNYDRIFQPNHSLSSTLLTTTPHHHHYPASAVIGSPPSHLGAIASRSR
ncbi:hypothetical protein BV898_12072 [Hypsibius exemplaris]|uniref:Rho-GAP domain-containing protein n=1 Tax=Hypsibius exemplaris TaxID=2072580 RepID=A0A1W0WER9_HYPEX|nr:hypothetical protein BV898_12072 [Hypsibius exemplaris]